MITAVSLEMNHAPAVRLPERRVKDCGVVVEERRRVARIGRPECHGRAPARRYGRAGIDIRRNAAALKEPHADTIVVPQHCKAKGDQSTYGGRAAGQHALA